MISSINNAFHMPTNTQPVQSNQSASISKTRAMDSDGDNDGSKPGEIEQSEQGKNNTNDRTGSIVNLKV